MYVKGTVGGISSELLSRELNLIFQNLEPVCTNIGTSGETETHLGELNQMNLNVVFA